MDGGGELRNRNRDTERHTRSSSSYRLTTNSINFSTNDTHQHPSGLEYCWPPDVQGLLLHVFDQGFSLDFLARDDDTHSS